MSSRADQQLYAALLDYSKRKVQTDATLLKIKDSMAYVIALQSSPFADAEEHPMVKTYQEMYKTVLEQKYPALYKQPVKILPGVPMRLTLEQIDHRLCLFIRYLQYKLEYLDEWDCMVQYRICQMQATIQSTGMSYYYHYEEPEHQTFDGWLFINGYYNLVDIILIF